VALKFKRSKKENEPQIYGNENFGIPKDCYKKQKFSTIKLVLYITAVVAICVVGYGYYQKTVDRFLPEITFDKTREPIVYKKLSTITVEIPDGDKYNLGINSNIEYDNESKYIKTVNSGKSIFFLAQNPDDNIGFDLLVYNLSGDKNSDGITLIDKNVTDFKVNSDGKHVVYKKGSSLYFSDLTDTHMISEDVCDYTLSKNNQVVVFFKDDGRTMYTCGTAEDQIPVLVDHEITSVISPELNASTIYYLKNNTLYEKKYESISNIVAEDVIDAIMLGDSLYFTKEESYEIPFTDIFSDEYADSDQEMNFPKKSDYTSQVGGKKTFDEEAFREATLEYEKMLTRDEIRYYFEINPVTFTGNSLYTFENDQLKLVDTYLKNPNLKYNSNKNILLYQRYDTAIEKVDLTDIESIDEAITSSSEVLAKPMEIHTSLLKKGKAPFTAFHKPPVNQLEVSLDGKYIYCIENLNKSDFKALYRYEIGSSSLKNKVKISSDVTDFAVDGSDSSAVMVFDGNSLSFFYNNQLTHLSDTSCRDFFFVDETLFFYDEYDHSTKTGTLKSIRNGKISHIDYGVRTFDVRNYDTVAYVKHFKPELGAGTLYIKSGKINKRYDMHVSVIIN